MLPSDCTAMRKGGFGTRKPTCTAYPFVAFPDKYKAYEFEKYLKSGSGRAFRTFHLIAIDSLTIVEP